MIADLKDKAAGLAAGIDRKRIYTGAAALVIAGAAGHFMEDSRGTPRSAVPIQAATMAGPIVPAPAAPGLPPEEPAAPEVVTRAEAPALLAPVEPVAEAVIGAPVALVTSPQDAPMSTMSAPAEIAPAAAAAESVLAEASPEALPVPAFADIPMPSPELAAILAEFEPAPPPEPTLPEPPAADSFMLAALDDPTDPAPAVTDAVAEEPEISCKVELSAEPQPGAMVALSFSAPCNSGEDVDINHDGLLFSERLGPDGSLYLLVPAMTETAVFVVTYGDGAVRTAEAVIEDFSAFERVALIWQGATGFQLHALENGASYGEPGHVWAEEPGTASQAVNGEGGFVSVLGSTADGYAADVYTYPAGLMVDGAGPEISIEAQVMENTCGSPIEGTVLRTSPNGLPMAQPLSIAVPGCDAVGEYLVLKNLPQDLKLARN